MMLSVFLLLASTFAFSGGALQIDSCADGWLDVEEGVITRINCSGLVEAGTRSVTWSMNSYNNDWQIAQCATSTCESSQPYFQRVIMDDDNTTQLVTKEIDRDRHGNKTVKCLAGIMDASCSLNVISRAVLSDCRVDNDTDWTVRGSCQFNKAYSFLTKSVSCKWYQKYKGVISFLTDGIVIKQLTTQGNKTYYNGSCSFSVNISQTESGTHTFYIEIMPGPGKTETGHIEISKDVPDTADTTLPVAAIAGGAVGGVAVIVLIAVIVWFVLHMWRLQKNKSHVHQAKDDDDFEEHENPLYGTEDKTVPIPQSSSKPSAVKQLCTLYIPDNTAEKPSINSNLRQTATDNDQSTEEYAVVETTKSPIVPATCSDISILALAESSPATAVSGSATTGQQDQTQAKSENVSGAGTKRSAAAGFFEVTLFSNTATPGSSGSLVRVGSDPSSTKQDQKNQDTNTALYADQNREDACNPNPYENTTERSMENVAESKPKVQPKPAPSGDVYAVVDKPGVQTKQAQSGDVYAVVDKPGVQTKQAQSGDMYAVVDKSRNKSQETTGGDVYAVVDKTKKLPASGFMQNGNNNGHNQ